MSFSIGQLAKRANVSNRTLRYYEELGLITPKSRGENRYRYYDDSHLSRLNTIKMLQDAGFALKEIVAAYSPILDPNGNVTYTGQEAARKIYLALKQQREKLEEKQRELGKVVEEINGTLHHLHDCFGCKVSATLKDCSQCEVGPREVTSLANDRMNGNGKRPVEPLSAGRMMARELDKS
jgi:MerR family transcriptional regulator, Zn(II)-responsive regulator of zntA